MVWPWAEFNGMPNSRQLTWRLSLCKHLSLCRIVNFKLFANGFITLPRLIRSNSCFSEVMPDVGSSWREVNTTPRAPGHQTATRYGFIETVTLAADLLVDYISNTCLLNTLLFVVEAGMVYSFPHASWMLAYFLEKIMRYWNLLCFSVDFRVWICSFIEEAG